MSYAIIGFGKVGHARGGCKAFRVARCCHGHFDTFAGKGPGQIRLTIRGRKIGCDPVAWTKTCPI